MNYTPDCADCPTPKECQERNDCLVLRQIRHGHEASMTPFEICRLREEARRMAEEAEKQLRAEQLKHLDQFVAAKEVVESALLAFAKLVLGAGIHKQTILYKQCVKHQGIPWSWTGFVTTTVTPKVICPICEPPDRAMTRELMKELTEEDRNAETKRSTA